MESAIGFLNKIGEYISKIVEVICVILTVIMTTIILVNVFYRYVLRMGLPWAEETVRYMLVWMVMLGNSIVFFEEEHITVDFFLDKFEKRNLIRIIHIVITIIFLIIFVISGLENAEFGRRLTSPTLGISRFIPFVALPIGGILMIIQCFIILVNRIYEQVKR